MKNKKIFSGLLLVFVFAVVFLATFFYKRSQPSRMEEGLNLAQLSQHLNEVGYVGWEVLLCADDDRCPPNYDPQSALGLLPYVKLAEDETFIEIMRVSKTSKSLGGLIDGMANCSKYCACVVWERFLASQYGKDFQVDFEKRDNDGTCQPWELLSPEEKVAASKMLNYIESLEN